MEKFRGSNENQKWQQVATEILAMAKEDQKVRTDLGNKEEVARMAKVDRRNTAKLREIVAEHGWPKISVVGQEVSHKAWLLAQHADHAPNFQLSVVDKMINLGPEVEKKDLAFLIDRVLVNLTVTAENQDLKFEDSTVGLMQRIEDMVAPKLRLKEPLSETVMNADTRGIQIYGSQFTKYPHGEFGPRPILDRSNLDFRRANMGLGSFEDYDKEIREQYL